MLGVSLLCNLRARCLASHRGMVKMAWLGFFFSASAALAILIVNALYTPVGF